MSFSNTIYPTLVDGYAEAGGADTVWGTLIAGNGNASNTGSASIFMLLQSNSGTGNWQGLARAFFSFDPTTATFPAGSVVTAVTLSLWLTTKTDSFAQSLCICSGTLASSTGISNSDYQGTNSNRTEWATRKTVASLTTGALNVWTFNATGIAAVQSGIDGGTPIIAALRYSGDVDQVSPTWSSSVTDDNVFASQQDGTVGKRPQLAITYRIGPGHAVASLTGTLGNSGDSVTCNLWTVEVFT